MTNRNLMKPKAAITRRRLIITFILATILTVSVMTGFSSGFDSDGTAYTPDVGMNMVMSEKPTGGTPSDHDLLSAVKFTAYNIYQAPYFRGETVGDVIADLGIIKYTQHVHNIRVVKDDKIFSEAISSSSLVSVAEQKFFKGTDTVLYRPATSINGDTAVFADTAGRMPIDDYFKAYGVIPNEITKHYIHEDSIISVRDENAEPTSAVKSAVNAEKDDNDSDDAPEISFAVPDRLIPDADGNYRFTLELKPFESTKYYRNEVRTLAGADLNPVFRSVNVTFYINAQFYPISVTSAEVYDIAIPVIGAMTCSTTLTETFTDIGAEGDDAVLPEEDFFAGFIDSADIIDTGSTTRSPADYLASAFAPYLDGSSDLELAADIAIDGLKLDDVRLSVNIGTMDIKARLGSLAVQYADDKIYLALGDTKGYIPTSAFSKLSGNAVLTGLLGKIPDFGELLGEDILSTVFSDCQMTTDDGITTIHLPFALGDDISVDASLLINDDDMSLRSVSGTVKALGKTITVNARPEHSTFPEPDDSYADFSAVLDYVNDAVDFATGTTYGIAGTLDIQGVAAKIDAYIERGDSLTVDATVTVLGQDVNIVYAGDALYATLGNIKLKAAAADFPELISALGELIGTEVGTAATAIKFLMPDSIDSALRIIKSVDVSDEALNASLSLDGITLDARLERNATGLCGAKLGIDGSVFGTSIKASADLALSVPEKRAVTVPDDCVSLVDVLPLVKSLKDYITANGLTVDLDVAVDLGSDDETVEGADADNNDNNNIITVNATLAVEYATRAVKATVNAFGIAVDVTYIGDTAYVSVGDINVMCKIADVKELLAALKDVLPFDAEKLFDKLGAVVGDIDIASIADKAISSVKSISVADGVIHAELLLGNVGLDLDLPTGIDGASVSVLVNGANVGVVLNTVTPGCEKIEAPSAEYVPLAKLTPVINAVMPLINKPGYTLDIDGDLFGVALVGKVDIMPATDATEDAEAKPFALSAVVSLGDVENVSIKLIGEKLYIDIPNTLHVALGTDKDSIAKLTSCIKGLLPKGDDALGDVSALIAGFKALSAMNLKDIVGAVGLTDTATGVKLAVDLSALDIDASAALDIKISDGAVAGAELDIAVLGKTAKVDLTATDGVIDGAKLGILDCTVNAALNGFEATDITASGSYMSVDTLIKYVEPIYSYVSDLLAGDALGLKLSALVTSKAGKYMNIVCNDLTVDLSGKNVAATITLFAGTDAAQDVELCLINGKLYVKAGTIALSFDMSKPDIEGENLDPDRAKTDTERLYDILSAFLPDYLNTELHSLLGLDDNTSMLSSFTLLGNQIKQVAAAKDAQTAIQKLFTDLGGLSGKSAVLTLLDMIELCEADGRAVVLVSVLEQTLRIEPILATAEDGTTSLYKLNVRMALDGTEIDIDVMPGTPGTIQEPTGAFVSMVEFLETISDAVGTFTAVNPLQQNEITFEIPTLSFTYDKYATYNADGSEATAADTVTVGPVKDGTDKDGNDTYKKVLVGKITKHKVVDKDGNPVLDKNGKQKTEFSFALEAHITLDIASAKDSTGVITLDVYLVDNYPAPSTAYVKYSEKNTELSELLSIDSKSLLQILAAVMDIIDVDDDTMDTLFGDNRLNIDTSLFSSMSIIGLDSIKTTINDLASTVKKLETAIGELGDAWDIIKNAGTMDTLKGKSVLAEIKNHLEAALCAFKTDKAEDDKSQPKGGPMDGSLLKRIVNGVTFTVDETALCAEVKNEITTGGNGTANITVARSDGKLDAISISNLDVNTARIDASVSFVAGGKVEFSDAPDPTDPGKNTTYTDLSNIKRLLFDVMNTANLKEFQIGGFETNDSITVSIPIKVVGLNLDLVSIPIKYNVEVKLIDQGEKAEPRYMTAAVVELKFENCKIAAGATIVPDCTTRLYFYDDVLYVEGYRYYKDQWKTYEQVKVGGSLFKPVYEMQWVEHQAKDATFVPVSLKYTVKELAAMFSDNDMDTFLYNFLFCLLPLSTDFTIFGVDLQKTIYDAATKKDESANAEKAKATFATVFNSYTYDEKTGAHDISISLKALTGNKQFDDIAINITGANDQDDDTVGITNNYIATLGVTTKLSIVSLSLNATLKPPTQYIVDVDTGKLDENGKPIIKQVPYLKSAGIDALSIGSGTYKLYSYDKAHKDYNAKGDDIVYDYLLKNQDNYYTYAVTKDWQRFEDLIDKENKN